MPDYYEPPMRPDWVIVGATMRDGGVSLFASKTLDRADFEVDYGVEHVEFRGYMISPAYSAKVTLTCVMREFVWVQATDYKTAFTKLDDLFAQWTQEYERQKQRILPEITKTIPQGPRALPSGLEDT